MLNSIVDNSLNQKPQETWLPWENGQAENMAKAAIMAAIGSSLFYMFPWERNAIINWEKLTIADVEERRRKKKKDVSEDKGSEKSNEPYLNFTHIWYIA